MERFTKILVTLWVCVAIILQVWLFFPGWPDLLRLTVIAFIVALVAARFDRRAVSVVLVFAYVFPVVLKQLRGTPFPPYEVLWMSALAGVIVPDAFVTPWHIPTRWRGVLVLAVLVTMTAAMLITWREIDGTIPLISALGQTFWRGGNPPPFQVQWILNVALILVLGVLWFDWLCGRPELDFERVVVTPLVVSVAILALVAAYQVFFNIHFLNDTPFASLERATGSMYDANLSGMIAALWVGGAFLWGSRLRGWYVYAAAVVMALCLLAMWGSGSRTALMTGVTSIGGVILSLVLAGRRRVGRWSVIAGAGVALLLVGTIVVVGMANPKALNPGARLWATLTSFPTPAALLAEMWNRNAYGTGATILIKRYPYFGIGIGSFNLFVIGAVRDLGLGTPPDNAQNWLRHQVAEFGFVGAMPWIVWSLMFAWYVVMPRRGEPTETWTARAALFAFGSVSLLGMPGQELMVVITFWVMAFWYLRLAGTPSAAAPLHWTTWTAMAVGVAIFAVGTASTSAATLRLPSRARADNQPFSYGVSPPVASEAGFRQVLPRAVVLTDVSSPWLVVRARRASTAKRPIDVRVTSDGETVVKGHLIDELAVEGFVPVTGRRVLLEISARPDGVARFWPFTTETGVLVNWEFVDQPPASFRRYTPTVDSKR